MSSNNIVSKLIIPMVFVGGTAYYLYKNSMKEKVHLDCQDHLSLLINRDKLLQIIEDLQIEFTPYYTYYYNLLKAMEEE
tara:strand:+ start:69 stop:305 length:237 start_codon:yes stop_codon:yes gene_type:complete